MNMNAMMMQQPQQQQQQPLLMAAPTDGPQLPRRATAMPVKEPEPVVVPAKPEEKYVKRCLYLEPATIFIDADDVDDAARGAGALTASAASTLKGRRAEDAAAPVDADPPPRELPHVASAASPWVAACADLLEAAKDLTNMRGLRKSLTSCGFRCGPEQGRSGDYYAITVPPDFPCYYDIVGKEYAARDYVFGLATLRKYLDGALALAGTGGAFRTDAEYKHDRSTRSTRGCFRCPAGCARTFTYAPAAIQHGRFCRAGGARPPRAAAPVPSCSSAKSAG